MDAAEYEAMYARSVTDPDGFWGEVGKRLDWIKPFTKVKNTSFAPGKVSIKWYEDGALNVSANCVDRHLVKRANQIAIIFEPDDPNARARRITYRELHEEVGRFANTLKAQGVRKGDRVTIYMPMIPETAYAMLACTRIGAVHSVVFGGFSPDSIAGRIEDCASEFVVTADEGVRGGRKIPLKANIDAALEKCPGVKSVIVVRHTGGDVAMKSGRDLWYHDASKGVSTACEPEAMNAEDPLFILYTSGSTGKPKGVLHTTGGYLVFASYTHQMSFDYHDGDIYWCTADVGWVTGHSYVLYGPLANGATTLMFEGVPNYPSTSRFWEVVDKHKVNIFYTAPTAIRALMGAGDDPVKKTSRKSLRLLATVGEPINPEAWEWYYRVVGRQPLPGHRHMVANRDRRPSHYAAAGRDAPEARIGDKAVFRCKAGTRRCRRQGDRRSGRGQSCHYGFVARPDAHRLRRSSALHGDLFLRLSEHVLHGRRLPPRRGRLLLDHRPRRRRAQRVGTPARHGGSRKRPCFAPQSVRGRRRRLPAQHQGPGHLRLCDPDVRRTGVGRSRGRSWCSGCARRSARSLRRT